MSRVYTVIGLAQSIHCSLSFAFSSMTSLPSAKLSLDFKIFSSKAQETPVVVPRVVINEANATDHGISTTCADLVARFYRFSSNKPP